MLRVCVLWCYTAYSPYLTRDLDTGPKKIMNTAPQHGNVVAQIACENRSCFVLRMASAWRWNVNYASTSHVTAARISGTFLLLFGCTHTTAIATPPRSAFTTRSPAIASRLQPARCSASTIGADGASSSSAPCVVRLMRREDILPIAQLVHDSFAGEGEDRVSYLSSRRRSWSPRSTSRPRSTRSTCPRFCSPLSSPTRRSRASRPRPTRRR